MLGKGRLKNSRNIPMMLDILHIVVGIAVVILAALAFINPEGNRVLLPLIFLLAGILNAVNGYYRIKESGRDKKRRLKGISILGLAVVLLIICVLSAVSMWR
jgi:hypothetical protein